MINRLLDYVEHSISKRLDSIEAKRKRNDFKFEKIKRSYFNIERKVLEAKTEMNPGNNLISDDIKFFFNLVKGSNKYTARQSSSRIKRSSSRRHRNSSNKKNDLMGSHQSRESRFSRKSVKPSTGERYNMMNQSNKQKSSKRRSMRNSHSNFSRYNLSRSRERRSMNNFNNKSPLRQRNINSSKRSLVKTPSNKRLRKGSKSNMSINSIAKSGGKTNQKELRKKQKSIKHLDFMNTVDIKGKSACINEANLFNKHGSSKVYNNRKIIQGDQKKPRRWERLYNLAAQKEIKIKKLQEEVHGYTFEGDPRIKESCKKRSKSRASQQNKTNRSMSKSKMNSSNMRYREKNDDATRRTHHSRSRDKVTQWGSYTEGSQMVDGSIMFSKSREYPKNGEILPDLGHGKISANFIDYSPKDDESYTEKDIGNTMTIKTISSFNAPPIPSNKSPIIKHGFKHSSKSHFLDPSLKFNSIQRKLLEELPDNNLDSLVENGQTHDTQEDPFRGIIQSRCYKSNFSSIDSQNGQMISNQRGSNYTTKGEDNILLNITDSYRNTSGRKSSKIGIQYNQLENIKDPHYEKENNDDTMPQLIKDDIKTIPLNRGINNLNKEQFLKVMMQSYNSKAPTPKKHQRQTLLDNQPKMQKHAHLSSIASSKQSHIEIQSNYSQSDLHSGKHQRSSVSINDARHKYPRNTVINQHSLTDGNNGLDLFNNSFSKELEPLREQAQNGLFDPVGDDQNVENIDAMIDDYKKSLGLAIKQSNNFNTNQTYNDEALGQIKDVKKNVSKELETMSLSSDDNLWSQLEHDKEKLLAMIDDVLSSSERNQLKKTDSDAIFKKLRSIQLKEKILSECGIKKMSKASIVYNSTTTNDYKLDQRSVDNGEVKIFKNIELLKNVLIQNQQHLANKENNFGIDIEGIKNGEFKKSPLSNYISFNKGETMYVGSIDGNRKTSLPVEQLNSISKQSNNITFNGSNFFSKNSRKSSTILKQEMKENILSNDSHHVQSVNKGDKFKVRDIFHRNQSLNQLEGNNSIKARFIEISQNMQDKDTDLISSTSRYHDETFRTKTSIKTDSNSIRDRINKIRGSVDNNSIAPSRLLSKEDIKSLKLDFSTNPTFQKHFETKKDSLMTKKSSIIGSIEPNTNTNRQEISIQGLEALNNTLGTNHSSINRHESLSHIQELRENINYDTEKSKISEYTSRDGLKEIQARGVNQILNEIQRKQDFINNILNNDD